MATQEYPLQMDNYINFHVAYLYDGETEKAMAEIERAVALQPDDSVALEDIIANAPCWTGLRRPNNMWRKRSAPVKGISLLVFSAMVPYADWKQDFTAVESAALINSRQDGFIAAAILSKSVCRMRANSEVQSIAFARERKRQKQLAQRMLRPALVLNEGSIGWPTGDCHDIKGSIRQALPLDHGVSHADRAATALFTADQWDESLRRKCSRRDRPQDEPSMTSPSGHARIRR